MKLLKIRFNEMALLTESWKADTIVFLIGAIPIIYWLLKRNYSYWDRRGFKTHPDLVYILGHFYKLFVKRMHISEFLADIYKSTDEPFIGIYGLLQPVLIVRDPELIRAIMIKDFSHFPDRMYCTHFEIVFFLI